MKILVDTHTHTIASGHAYSTINEMVLAAKEKGLEMLAITDHTSSMPGAAHDFNFINFRVIPRERFGVKLLMGAEVNIIDYEGKIDLDEEILEGIDIVVASLHRPCIRSGTIEENTNALIGAMKNPYVNIIGHPDDGRYPVDYEKLVRAAKETNVLLELNNNSLNPEGFRTNTKENDIKMLNLCKEHEVMITMGSDAHISDDVANCTYSKEVIETLSFPKELIVNYYPDKLMDLIARKRGTIK